MSHYPMNAFERRQSAVEKIVFDNIGQVDDGDLGRLIRDVSFADLFEACENLRFLGRTDKWNKAVDKFRETIQMCFDTFCNENDISEGERSHIVMQTQVYFAEYTRREFIRLVKHAIYQGTTYVWNI